MFSEISFVIHNFFCGWFVLNKNMSFKDQITETFKVNFSEIWIKDFVREENSIPWNTSSTETFQSSSMKKNINGLIQI